MKVPMPKTRLLLLGGGLTHACLLGRLSRAEQEQLKIILIAPFPLVYYLEMAGGYLEGIFSETEIAVNMLNLCDRRGAKYLEGNPAAINIPGKSVVLEDGRVITFDILSLNMDGNGRELEGVAKFGLPVGYRDNIKVIKQRFINRSVDRNITVVGAGRLGIEICLSLRRLLNQYSRNVNITLIDAAQSLLYGYDLKVKQIMLDELKQRRIEVLLGRRVVRVTGDMLIFNDNSVLDYGYLIWTAKPAAYPVFSQSGLPVDEKGRLQIKPSLQTTVSPDIFGCGESIVFQSPEGTMPGFHPDKEAEILLNNIILARKGRVLKEYIPLAPDPKMINPGNKRAVTQKNERVLENGLGWRLAKARMEKIIKPLQ